MRVGAAIPDDDADLRAALLGATLIGVVPGPSPIELDELAAADPRRIILEPCIRSLTRADGRPFSPRR